MNTIIPAKEVAASIWKIMVGRDWIAGARWAETKLKEKNGG
jgi:hypothetical protein